MINILKESLSIGHTLVHLNSNLLCAADIWTTGPDPKRDAIIGVCVLPLNSFYEVYKQLKEDVETCGRRIVPFDIEIKPNRTQHIKDNIRDRKWIKTLPKGVNKTRILHAATEGIDVFKAADYFDSWYQDLRLPFRKKISLLTHNWLDKKPFMVEWLGYETYNQIFDDCVRDVVSSSLYANDRADFRNASYPYPKNFFRYLCSQLKISHDRGQDLVSNCVGLAQIWKEMVSASEVPF